MNMPPRLSALLTLAVLVLASVGLSGCSGLMTTTNTADAGVGTTSDGLDASTNVSVTKPEGYRYARARQYVASQMPMIRSEAAAGGGENIRALATLMGEPDARAFGDWMQANYARLFTNLDKPGKLIARINRYRQPTRM